MRILLYEIEICIRMKTLEDEFGLTKKAKVQAKGENVACNNY
ncbi:hypothetical protein [Bacillus luti]